MDINTYFEDEGRFSDKEILAHQRLRASLLSAGGWLVGERFNDCYDTMVGGFSTLVTQSIDENRQMQGGFSLDKFVKGDYPTVRRPSYIVDYDDGGKHTSASDAEKLPDLVPVLSRLREREVAYDAYLAKRGK